VIGGSVFSKNFSSCHRWGGPQRNLNTAGGVPHPS